MFTAIHIAHAVSHYSTGLSLTLDETAAIVIGAAVVAIGTWSIRKNHEILARNRAISTDVHEIKVALIGAEPTELNQNPQPGLIKVVEGHSSMLKDLLADKKPNGGSTTRDAIDRIEGAIGSAPSAVATQKTTRGQKAS